MAKVVVMPKLGLTMTEGTVSKWLKKVGDEIKSGEPFFEVETDKLTNTIEANTDGVVRHFFVEEGTTVPVLDKVAIIAAADEDISALLGGAPAAAAAPEAPAAAAPAASAAPVRAPGERVVAAPAAKKLAKELGIDLALVPGTGPNGRITLDDVKNWKPAPAAPAAPAAEEAPKTKASPLAAAVAKDLGIDLDQIGAKKRGFDAMDTFGLYPSGSKVTEKPEILFARLDLKEVMEKVEKLHPPVENQTENAEENSAAEPAEKETEIELEPKEELTIDDFGRPQFAVGEVIACEAVKKSRKLLCSKVKIGSQVRQIVSGIKGSYSPEEMVSKKVMVLVNLKTAKLAGIESEGMILCAEDPDGNLSLMVPEKDLPAGSEIC